jgi:hypothetical protein
MDKGDILMDRETGWEFRTRKLILAYWAVVPFMFILLLIYIILKDNVENRTMYIVLNACAVVFFSANSLWLLKVPIISMRDNRIAISNLLFLRKILRVEFISSVSFKRRISLIVLSNGDSVRFPMSWLDKSEQTQLRSCLLQIVQNNQVREGLLKPD